jgi:hypothetical protein
MYMSKTRKEHWTTVKRVFRNLCGTKDCGGDSGKLNVHGFVDTDWAG